MDRILLGKGPLARVELDGRVLDLPIFVTRLADDAPPGDGVLLREGEDAAVALVDGRAWTLPLYREAADGAPVRVRVQRLSFD